MSCLNKDVLLLIFEELKNDHKSLYSCLLVNRTWCTTAVLILWRNPPKKLITDDNSKNILFNVILLHLSEEYHYSLFNYINFWRYLDLSLIVNIIPRNNAEDFSILRNEILKLLINKDTK